MPIYEYKCSECSHTLELLQKVTAPPPVDCPVCGKPALVKQVTAAGFQLKGSGWYVTDFRDGGASKKDPKLDSSKDGSKDGATDVKSGAESESTNAAAPAKDAAGKNAAVKEATVKDAAARNATGGAAASSGPGSAPSPSPSPAAPASGSGSGTSGTA